MRCWSWFDGEADGWGDEASKCKYMNDSSEVFCKKINNSEVLQVNKCQWNLQDSKFIVYSQHWCCKKIR